MASDDCLTYGLSFGYSQKMVLKDINFQLPSGCIMGLLGANGSGKTTFLKCLLGLLPVATESISWWGNHDITRAKKQIGSLIEHPTFIPNMTATENLAWFGHYLQNPQKDKIHQILDWVGLLPNANQKTGDFSMGMLQRLGIAKSLLNNPKALLLDEPINGLDPQGVVDIRNLLLHLNQEFQTTILISSHLLAEINLLCSHATILHHAKICYQGTLSDLKKQSTQQQCLIQSSNTKKLEEILQKCHYNYQIHPKGYSVTLKNEQPEQLNHLLVTEGVPISHLELLEIDLETQFLQLTQNPRDSK